MQSDEEFDDAQALMTMFAERTGLAPERSTPTRYLWTDAFAVCNYLGLAQQQDKDKYVDLAVRLVRQVHRSLGYHHPDGPRRGPISGLSEQEAALHPTAGGLRIGKPLPERRANEPLEPRLEYERDGQYFHDLTKWMHALDRVGTVTGDASYHRWARELAVTAHRAFSQGAGFGRMYWKMSADLRRPLVTVMGQRDPLDALVTYCQLQASPSGGGPELHDEIRDAAAMCQRIAWASVDALGIGGLLIDASRIAQVVAIDASYAVDAIEEINAIAATAAIRAADRDRERDASEAMAQRDQIDQVDAIEAIDAIDAMQPGPLLTALLDAARIGLVDFVRSGELVQPPERRVAFRELGLAIGLAGLPLIDESRPSGRGDPGAARARLAAYEPLRDDIVGFWRDARRRRVHMVHRDIDEVMLATALVPGGFLRLR